jgi:hypothetical protein
MYLRVLDEERKETFRSGVNIKNINPHNHEFKNFKKKIDNEFEKNTNKHLKEKPPHSYYEKSYFYDYVKFTPDNLPFISLLYILTINFL